MPAGVPPRQVLPRWPNGHLAAAFFSFDVDGESWLLSADRGNGDLPVTMSQARYGPRVGVYEILRVLARRGIQSTFFVPSAVAMRYPDTVRAIIGEGHEVGLHGVEHERPDLLSPDHERAIMDQSITTLAGFIGASPSGYRAPGAEVSPHTIEILAAKGVSYDSSFMDDVFPYFHDLAEGPSVLELPIHWTLDDWSYSMNSPYARPVPHANPIRRGAEIAQIWIEELQAIVEMGGLFVLVNHPQVTGRASRLGSLETTIREAQSDSRIWVANGQQLNDWWRKARPASPSGLERMRR